MVGFPVASEATSPVTIYIPMERKPASGIIHAGLSSTCYTAETFDFLAS
jgi:hypothetical protein